MYSAQALKGGSVYGVVGIVLGAAVMGLALLVLPEA